jgi:hypothetical protein
MYIQVCWQMEMMAQWPKEKTTRRRNGLQMHGVSRELYDE